MADKRILERINTKSCTATTDRDRWSNLTRKQQKTVVLYSGYRLPIYSKVIKESRSH